MTNPPVETVDRLLQLIPMILRRGKPPPQMVHDCPGGSLAHSEMRILLQLALHERESVGRIADAIGMSRPAVTEAVDRLVEKAMVVRIPSVTDRRLVLLELTPEAQVFAERLVDYWRRAFVRTLSTLSEDEQAAFVKGMVALTEALHDPLPNLPAGVDAGLVAAGSRPDHKEHHR